MMLFRVSKQLIDPHNNMSDRIIADNIYQAGSQITAKAYPLLKLKIERYYQRIYYCSIVDAPQQKHLVFFERELAPQESPANRKNDLA
jgi:hypothetical protein